jgi:hypothetical protein
MRQMIVSKIVQDAYVELRESWDRYIPSDVQVHLMDYEVGVRRMEYIIENGIRRGMVGDALLFSTRRYTLALLDDFSYIYDKYNLVLHRVNITH